MARYVIPSGISRIVRDAEGNAVAGAIITVYLAGSMSPATIYDSYTATVPVGSVTTDAYGRFIIFVDDTDYPLTTNFRLITSFGGTTTTDDYVR